MIMQFRTARNASGNCKYIAFNTDSKQFATEPSSWGSKDIPVLTVRDYKNIVSQV